MPSLKIMTAQDGHKEIKFEKENQVSIAEAMKKFNYLVKRKKSVAYAIDPITKDGSQIKEFSPDVDIVIHPQLGGG